MFVFSIIIPVISAIYAILILFKKPKNYFKAITAIYIALIISLTSITINSYNRDFLNEYNFIDEFVIEKLIDKKIRNNSIVRNKISKIQEQLKSINSQSIELSYDELKELGELRMKELSLEGLEYLSTHIVKDDKDADIFIDQYVENYQNVPAFLKIQKKNVENGGTVKRIFVFHKKWLLNNIDKAKLMVKNHESIFDNNPNVVSTFMLYKDAEYDKIKPPKVLELCILNKNEVFKWLEDEDGHPYRYSGGKYIIEPTKVEELNRYWNSLYDNSFRKIDDLLKKINK